jgi:NADH dehydrogenase
MSEQRRPRVVIIGGGFGGLYAAKAFRRKPVDVTVIDRRNFHLFQPLLYQVATGGLSPGDISSPIRTVLHRQTNTHVIQAEVTGLDPDNHRVLLRDGAVEYDLVIVATGVRHSYFGNDKWASDAPGLKTVEDALDIRRRIFIAFETAEREPDPRAREAWLTFVVVGGGPTGVELCGALGELCQQTLRPDFQNIDTRQARILLLEGLDRVLPTYPPDLSKKAAKSLEKLGVTVRTNTMLVGLEDGIATASHDDSEETIHTKTVLWAAGVQASHLGTVLAERAGAELDKVGKVKVGPDLAVPGQDNIFVIGDLAHYAYQTGEPLPGVAQVAMQQGKYVAELIGARLSGKDAPPFRYRDKGNLAVIGRNRAVADIYGRHLSGFVAWLVWVFIHITYLIEFDNRLKVMVQWAADYLTRKRGARLITGPGPFPDLSSSDQEEE